MTIFSHLYVLNAIQYVVWSGFGLDLVFFWFISGYAHVFILLSVVIVLFPIYARQKQIRQVFL